VVTISCSGKFHAFALAEQLANRDMLDQFFTTYASMKNDFFSRIVNRDDRENIPAGKIRTNIPLAFPLKLWQKKAHVWNHYFDLSVARRIKKTPSRVFIGWSGMSLHSIRAARKGGLISIVERGSSHILFQNELLTREYSRYGLRFHTHPDVLATELKEYEEADYISVPSHFVKKTFLDRGVPEEKIFLNPYGVKKDFTDAGEIAGERDHRKLKILYLGTLSYRKGLLYLFEALNLLDIPQDEYEVDFIGKIEKSFYRFCKSYRKDNWHFMGHIDHNQLPGFIRSADVGVIPSIEDGFGMVIPQLMACRIPVITTINTGGNDLIRNGENGFVIPIRDSRGIAQKIELLYNDRALLSRMKEQALSTILEGNTWKAYGDRYTAFLKKIVK
jgi:glycosyltransferase involved in cell wall biosynthesis